jgi:RNA polymerase sigma-70 factor (ECF subfamily)
MSKSNQTLLRDGPIAGLDIIDPILNRGGLHQYYLIHAARADLLRRLGNKTDAIASYCEALSLTHLQPERRFLEKRFQELG